MSPVPGIERDVLINAHDPQVRVTEGALKICLLQRSEKPYPAAMQSIEQVQRELDWGVARVVELGPAVFEIRFDRRFVFGNCEFESRIAVEMAFGNMVHHLANGPAFGAVWSV